MLRKAVLLCLIMFQFVRLASSMGTFDVTDNGTSLNFSSAIALVNQNLRVHFNPVKTLLNFSTRLAATRTPAQPAHDGRQQRPVETTLILSSSPELVKTNSPIAASAALFILSSFLLVLYLILARREGIVLCRIQHLFSRAREGICAYIRTNILFNKSLLIRYSINRDFLFNVRTQNPASLQGEYNV